MKKEKTLTYAIILMLLMLFSACGNIGEAGKKQLANEQYNTQASLSQIPSGVEENNTEETQETEETEEKEKTEATENAEATEETEAVSETCEPSEELLTDPDMQDISLIMVGDVLLHTRVEESALTEDGTYDFSAIFSNTKEKIAAADLALVNQEVIIGGEELGVSGYPGFNAPYEIGDELVETGFDVVCHATNHALDKRKKGLLNCLSFWQENYSDIAVLGIYDSQEKRDNIYVYEQNGIKIAILNYTYGTNGIDLPKGMPYAVNLLDKEQVLEDIQKAKELADFTIVCPHWGTEYELKADPKQKAWVKLFAKNGVDLVIGTHPHVIEPIEWIEDEESGHQMLVYYSLGNFVNWTSGTKKGTANRMVGGMAGVTIGYLDDGTVGIKDYGVTALVSHVEEGFGGVTTYSLADYSEQLAQNNEIRKQDSSFSYEYAVDLCNEVWGDIWE